MLNKRMYIKPVLESETFVPQNYIAACGDPEGSKYLFECNAPSGKLYYYNRWGNAEELGDYHPCYRTHEAPKSDEFPYGFIDYNKNEKEDKGESVRVWLNKGPWGIIYNAHATNKLNQEDWGTTAKS